MIKKIQYILSATLFLAPVCMANDAQKASENEPTIALSVAPAQYQAMRVLLSLNGDCSTELLNIASVIKGDLEYTGQFQIDVRTMNSVQSKKEMTQLCVDGYALAIFLSMAKDGGIEWRVYDTALIHMLKGEKYAKRGTVARGWAHNVADNIWPVITGQHGFFSSKIAYCKDVHQGKKRKVKHVCVADYDGSNEQVLVNAPTVNIAPRWNNDVHNPLLFYSDYTNANVRLIAVNMKKQRKIASNYDGINMLPAFSDDGKRVIYCASKGKGSCQLYYYENTQVKQLTRNGGNNVSPCFTADKNKILFCSDFQTGQPQIYAYDLQAQSMVRLTDGGYCASPAYCANNNMVAYSKKVNGVMQVMLYDPAQNKHEQVTFDNGNKEECSWSPCGTFVLYSTESHGKSRIAQLNVTTRERRFITPESVACSYPAWSPMYEQFVILS